MGVLSLILRLPSVVIDCPFPRYLHLLGQMLLFALVDDILVNTFMAREANQHWERITYSRVSHQTRPYLHYITCTITKLVKL